MLTTASSILVQSGKNEDIIWVCFSRQHIGDVSSFTSITNRHQTVTQLIAAGMSAGENGILEVLSSPLGRTTN
jgi:hypothetical protein